MSVGPALELQFNVTATKIWSDGWRRVATRQLYRRCGEDGAVH